MGREREREKKLLTQKLLLSIDKRKENDEQTYDKTVVLTVGGRTRE